MAKTRLYENVTVKIEVRHSDKKNTDYVAVVGVFKNSRNENQEIILGFDKLAKDIVFNL